MVLINGRSDLWRVVQTDQVRRDSVLEFYKLNSDGSFNEIDIRNGKIEEYDSNPDVLNWHTWQLPNDSIFEIADIRFRVVNLTDSITLFQNIKRPQDSLRLVRVKVINGAVTKYQ